MPEPHMQSMHFKVPPKMAAAMQRAAEREDRNLSHWIRRAVEQALRKNGKEKHRG